MLSLSSQINVVQVLNSLNGQYQYQCHQCGFDPLPTCHTSQSQLDHKFQQSAKLKVDGVSLHNFKLQWPIFFERTSMYVPLHSHLPPKNLYNSTNFSFQFKSAQTTNDNSVHYSCGIVWYWRYFSATGS